MDISPNARLSAASFNALKLFYKLGAECCFAKALYQECVHTILEALKFNPEDPELWCLYAKVFIMKKAFEYAKPLLEKALEIDPSYVEAKDLLTILKNNIN
jgi:tetratricopeptide (TPR) repeat protein